MKNTHGDSKVDQEKIPVSQLKKFLKTNNISDRYLSVITGFDIVINNEMTVTITKLIRVVPNRRLVFQGLLIRNNAAPVLVIFKIFVDDSKYQKDYNSIQYGANLLHRIIAIKHQVTDFKLNTPHLIAAQLDDDNKQAYFIHEYVSSDIVISEDEIHHTLIKTLSYMHDNNVAQSDLHLDNFIIDKKTVYCLDPASFIEIHAEKEKLNNFSLFIAQLPIIYYKNWPKYIRSYLGFRNRVISEKLESSIIQGIQHNLDHRLFRYANKSLRDCTDFKKIDDRFVSGMIQRKYDEDNDLHDFFEEFMKDSKSVIENNTVQILKDGNSAQVFLLSFKDKNIVVKRYLSGSIGKTILNTIQFAARKLLVKFNLAPRAINSWRNAHLLAQIGVNTARPMAYVFNKNGLMVTDSFFIMEYLDDFNRCQELLTHEEPGLYIERIKELLEIFNFLKIAHRDFKSVNIGFKNEEVFLLDLDAMRKYSHDFCFKRYKSRDKLRFMKCWQHDPKILTLLNRDR